MNKVRGSSMEKKKSPPDEGYCIRCPRLGHQIGFSYCRSENRGLPCFKALDCWYSHFEVAEFLKAELTPAEWQKAFNAPPKPKLVSLVELIEQARKATATPSGSDGKSH
jgi:hypothetical protein